MSALAATLLLASAALSASDRAALDAATVAIFAPYRSAENGEASWERDIWSREVRSLVTKWETVRPQDEPDALNDGDWLCQCQDWDEKRFAAKIVSRAKIGADAARVAVRVDLGHGEKRKARLTFVRERGRWLLDEIHDRTLDDGLKALIRQTIAEDEKLLRARP